MKYAQQSYQPEWFSPAEPLSFSATMGSSPFNEWYSFDSVTEAVNHIDSLFESSSFHDDFEIYEGTLYYSDDLIRDENGEAVGAKSGAITNDFQAAINAESPF